jgi:hypothetical protein
MSAGGYRFFQAANGVWVTSYVTAVSPRQTKPPLRAIHCSKGTPNRESVPVECAAADGAPYTQNRRSALVRPALDANETLPCLRHGKRGPAAVVRIVTLMGAAREVSHALRRDQQLAWDCGRARTSFRQAMPTESDVHVTKFAMRHVVHDDGPVAAEVPVALGLGRVR